ncbi:MAG: hypothetical protein VX949_02630 [Planctomycetota bacterium]|nr:hypothetical protein [Planctomycetota bacterium]
MSITRSLAVVVVAIEVFAIEVFAIEVFAIEVLAIEAIAIEVVAIPVRATIAGRKTIRVADRRHRLTFQLATAFREAGYLLKHTPRWGLRHPRGLQSNIGKKMRVSGNNLFPETRSVLQISAVSTF